jgi:hypothetical protein
MEPKDRRDSSIGIDSADHNGDESGKNITENRAD